MRTKLVYIVSFIVLLFLVCCKAGKEDRKNVRFMSYLRSRGIDPDTVKVFSRYYEDHFEYRKEQKRQELLKNPYIKINKVYFYRYGEMNLVLFSDEEEMYRNKFTINDRFVDIIGDSLVRIKQPIELWSYADFKLVDSVLYTLTKERAPYKEWYQTTTYFFRNDSIIADKTYKSDLHYQKKKWASTHKAYNIKMAYKPTLEVAEDFVTIKEHKIKHYYRRIFIKQIV
jgi:hypothetical protein